MLVSPGGVGRILHEVAEMRKGKGLLELPPSGAPCGQYPQLPGAGHGTGRRWWQRRDSRGDSGRAPDR